MFKINVYEVLETDIYFIEYQKNKKNINSVKQ